MTNKNLTPVIPGAEYSVFVPTVDEAKAGKAACLSHPVKITYFKQSGKYYTEEEALWPADPKHYTGWAPFPDVVRIKDMIAVCFDAPQGFPQMHVPTGLRWPAMDVRELILTSLLSRHAENLDRCGTCNAEDTKGIGGTCVACIVRHGADASPLLVRLALAAGSGATE